MNKNYLVGGIVAVGLLATILFFNSSDDSAVDLVQDFKSVKNVKKFQECSSAYDLHYLANVSMKNKQMNFTQKVKSDLNSSMAFRVFGVGKESVKVGFYFDPKSYKIDRKVQNKKGTNELFNHIVLVKMDQYGQIVDYEFPRSVYKDDEHIVLSLISPLQWIYDRDGNTSYSGIEVDILGEYISNYTPTKKIKKEYYAKDVKVIQSSLLSDIMKNSCWHKNATFSEVMIYDKAPNRPAMNTKIDLSINYTATLQKDHPLMQVDDFDTLWKEYSKPTIVTQSVRDRYIGVAQIQQLKQNNITLKTIFERLKKGAKEQHTFEQQLLLYLLNDPAAFDEVKAGIINDIYDEYQMGILLRVIGKMNKPKAQILLGDIMTGLVSNKTYQFWAALELGRQTTVIPDSVKEKLFEQTNYIGVDGEDQRRVSAAIYSLGALSNNLKDVDQDYVNTLNNDLTILLNATDKTEHVKQSYILGALANTRSSEFAYLGNDYIKSDDSLLRKRAVELLNNDPSRDSTIVLETYLMKEEDSIVKSNILESLKDRPPEDVKIKNEVISMAKNSPSKIIKNSAIDYLTYQLSPTQENKKVFIELLKQESSKTNVYKLVKKIESIK